MSATSYPPHHALKRSRQGAFIFEFIDKMLTPVHQLEKKLKPLPNRFKKLILFYFNDFINNKTLAFRMFFSDPLIIYGHFKAFFGGGHVDCLLYFYFNYLWFYLPPNTPIR